MGVGRGGSGGDGEGWKTWLAIVCLALQVVRLTEEPYQSATKGVKSPIAAERIADWLVSNKVLSIALGGTEQQTEDDVMSLCISFLTFSECDWLVVVLVCSTYPLLYKGEQPKPLNF